MVSQLKQHVSCSQKLQHSIVVVTGYSGAGKSTVLRALEDIGFFCVDNLPIPMLESFFQLSLQSHTSNQRIALGIDIRSGSSIELLLNEIKRFMQLHPSLIKIFFLTSTSKVLIKRFQETRRKHPLGDTLELSCAIQQEKELLQPLIGIADLVLDTDTLNIHQLRSFVRTAFATDGAQQLIVSIISFGFKYGIPLESNFVFDVRSLPNPYFVTTLKNLNGLDQKITEYLFEHNDVKEYWDQLLHFISFSLDKAHKDGRHFVTVAIGCTGGKHRSVSIAQKLAKVSLPHIQFLLEHRDIMRDRYDNEEQSQEIIP